MCCVTLMWWIKYIDHDEFVSVNNVLKEYNKMKEEIINLAGYNYVPKLHLGQPGFVYSACEPFTKNCERILNLEKQMI